MSTQDVSRRAPAPPAPRGALLGQQGVAAAENQLKRLISADLAALSGQRVEPRIAATSSPTEEQLLRWCDEAIALRPTTSRRSMPSSSAGIELAMSATGRLPQVDLGQATDTMGRHRVQRKLGPVRGAENESYSLGAGHVRAGLQPTERPAGVLPCSNCAGRSWP